MKVLEYWPISKLEPIGGPSGYLYYLSLGLKENNITDIDFLPAKTKTYDKKTKKLLMPFFFPCKIMSALLFPKGNKEIHKYDIVHFHNTHDLFVNRKEIKKFKGKVILTCHAPEPRFLEILHSVSFFERIIFFWAYLFLPQIDKQAFAICDRLVFPCKEALEPYHRWNYFKNKIESSGKIDYVLSGCAKIIAEENIDKYRNSVADKDDFLVCYVGRHNKIKGYDDLKLFASKILASDKKVSFVLCGVGSSRPLDHPKWHEIGWTKESKSYIKASDLFILPNRSTYFDLVLLEVLSQGKIVLISETGGNRFFKTFENVGIFFYNNEHEFMKNFNYIKGLSSEERRRLENANKELFNNMFSTKVFASNYYEYYKTL